MNPHRTHSDESTYPVADRAADEPGQNSDRHPVRETAQQVAEQTDEVMREVRAQAGDLVGQAQDQLREQARTAQRKAAESLRALADELDVMVHRGKQTGLATDVVRTVGQRTEDAARWLDEHDPGDLVEEVRDRARRHPGAFLLGSAALGLVVGRIVRGAAGGGRSTDGTPPAERRPTQPSGPESAEAGAVEPEPAPSAPLRPTAAVDPEGSEPPTVGEYVEEWERNQGAPLSPETSPAAPADPR